MESFERLAAARPFLVWLAWKGALPLDVESRLVDVYPAFRLLYREGANGWLMQMQKRCGTAGPRDQGDFYPSQNESLHGEDTKCAARRTSMRTSFG